jgi:hypothetical protein
VDGAALLRGPVPRPWHPRALAAAQPAAGRRRGGAPPPRTGHGRVWRRPPQSARSPHPRTPPLTCTPPSSPRSDAAAPAPLPRHPQAGVRSTLRATHLGDEHTFRLFAGQQRAIGEAMVVDKGGAKGVMGYKSFCEVGCGEGLGWRASLGKLHGWGGGGPRPGGAPQLLERHLGRCHPAVGGRMALGAPASAARREPHRRVELEGSGVCPRHSACCAAPPACRPACFAPKCFGARLARRGALRRRTGTGATPPWHSG